MNDTESLWILCSEALREQVSDAIWQAYLSGITPLSIKESEIVLGVPNTLIRDRVESRFLGLIQDTVTGTVGRDLEVQLEVVAPVYEPVEESPPVVDPEVMGVGARSGGGFSAGSSLWHEAPKRPGGERSGDRIDFPVLDPRYTFDTFVIASSNRFAHAAAQSVAESPARSYNPLFIYGDAGLGKTHLLHAIGNYVLENFSGRHVRYVTTETYMNEFVDAIRTNTTTAFKRRYRECDVLLIDDVQFMERKESLQEEFFHTFNSLYGASKQIVLTSDRPPKSIATLEDRLRSRFLSGLITEVQPPELETRLAILQTKAEHEQVDVPDEVLEFIATHVKDNIRELEGALIRVTAFASLNRQPMSRELAEVVLSDIVSADQPRTDHPRCDPQCHGRYLRLLRRGDLWSQPAAAPRHRPPGQHVRLQGVDRFQLSGDRTGVRGTRSLHRHARRRQGRQPHERTPPDLQPGDRPDRPDQEWPVTIRSLGR